MRRRLAFLVPLLITTCAVPMYGQSTVAGRGFFSAIDVWRERQRWLPSWLDDTPAKTWAWHGALTEAGGYGLSKVSPMSFRRGRQLVAAFYVARELYNVVAEGNRKYSDAAMDALVPVAVATLRVRVEFR
jgi:hypothetical protein